MLSVSVPTLKTLFTIFVEPSKMLVQFLVCFQSFTGKQPFAPSLLCCSIFTLVVVGAIHRVNLCYELLCNTVKH